MPSDEKTVRDDLYVLSGSLLVLANLCLSFLTVAERIFVSTTSFRPANSATRSASIYSHPEECLPKNRWWNVPEQVAECRALCKSDCRILEHEECSTPLLWKLQVHARYHKPRSSRDGTRHEGMTKRVKGKGKTEGHAQWEQHERREEGLPYS
jgi:hypothetical protein